MPAADPPPRRIRLLILGGTGFIGPWEVRYAQERGHEVTIFNRGKSAPGMFPGVEELTGDRAAGELSALRGRRWDSVIDNSASGSDAPDWVRDAAGLLAETADQYLFISTRSVYRDLSRVPATVDAPLYTPETTPSWSEGAPYPYGLAKALAEAELRKAFGELATIVRPGLIVGPGDDTDRFTYWPVRIERGGEVLAPGDPENDRVQVIDVRDLCEWAVRLYPRRATRARKVRLEPGGRRRAHLPPARGHRGRDPRLSPLAGSGTPGTAPGGHAGGSGGGRAAGSAREGERLEPFEQLPSARDSRPDALHR